MGWLLHRWDQDGKSNRTPELPGAQDAQWAARAAVASMAAPPLAATQSLKAFSVMTEKASAQKERYAARHPRVIPSWEPPELEVEAALVRKLLEARGGLELKHHRYPLPSGLTVGEALHVLVKDVERHAAFIHNEGRKPNMAPTRKQAATQ
jgi:hypothetical protein